MSTAMIDSASKPMRSGTKRKMWRCLQFEKREHALEKCGLGGDVTLMGASWQLDPAMIER
uniref:Uncharacterized protein n=1 Tax=Romanomermis culicivorax TaxID=13658 RepID=A0A915L6D2_ROMCU